MARKGTFLKKRASKIPTLHIQFLFKVFAHQNKTLHGFHRRGKHPIVGCIKRSRLGPGYGIILSTVIFKVTALPTLKLSQTFFGLALLKYFLSQFHTFRPTHHFYTDFLSPSNPTLPLPFLLLSCYPLPPFLPCPHPLPLPPLSPLLLANHTKDNEDKHNIN